MTPPVLQPLSFEPVEPRPIPRAPWFLRAEFAAQLIGQREAGAAAAPRPRGYALAPETR